MMRNKWGSTMLCLLLLILLSAQAYALEAPEYPVVIVDSIFFTADPPCMYAAKGGSVSFLLRFAEGFAYSGCDTEACMVEQTDEGTWLTISSVSHAQRIHVTAARLAAYNEEPLVSVIAYDANGGQWAQPDEKGGSIRTVATTLTYHIRPNTDNGTTLSRKGYTLLGWNTAQDGSGAHIGLGSRVDAGTTQLWAEWMPWTDAAQFTYRRNGSTIVLTGYKGAGSIDTLVIPGTIDGLPVAGIAGSFTTNMPCGTLNMRRLVLPNTLTFIENNAFSAGCTEELFFFDSLSDVGQNAFPNHIRTLHINAVLPPVYQKQNANARFADNIDLLIAAKGQPKLAFFAGCSMSYGLVSEMVQAAFPDRTVLNLGVIGGINAQYQMEIIRTFLEDGDVFVHAPEEMSSAQMLHNISCDYRMFVTVEGNYDLLSLADLSCMDDLWKDYASYVHMRSDETPGAYTDNSFEYNRYGDIMLSRPFDEVNVLCQDVTQSDGAYVFSDGVITDRGMDRLCGIYDSMRGKGVNVLISYAPVNRDGLPGTNGAAAFEAAFTTALSTHGWTPISRLEDYVLPGRYFYDSDYHLNEGGALLRTQQLIRDVAAALAQ